MILNIAQGSPEWLSLRKTKITATDSAKIMGLNPWHSAEDLLKEKLSQDLEPEPNEAMKRGTLLEPVARQIYEDAVGYKMKPTVHVGIDALWMPFHEEGEYKMVAKKSASGADWAMASTDGLSEDGRIVLEIKCGRKSFSQAKLHFIPDYYLCQVQHILWVTGAFECHYMAFDGKEEYVLMQIARNDAFICKMIDKEYDFYKEVNYLRLKSEACFGRPEVDQPKP